MLMKPSSMQINARAGLIEATNAGDLLSWFFRVIRAVSWLRAFNHEHTLTTRKDTKKMQREQFRSGTVARKAFFLKSSAY
jgi:hypothetical protein